MSSANATSSVGAARRLFWATFWLAFVLVGLKAFYLGRPENWSWLAPTPYFKALAAISYRDLLFVVALWSLGRVALTVCPGPRARTATVSLVTGFGAMACVYAVANLTIFGLFRSFLTYPLLALVGDVRMLRSSVSAHLTAPMIAALIAIPVAYLLLVWFSARPTAWGWSRKARWTWTTAPARWPGWARSAVALVFLAAWVQVGQVTYANDWVSRQDRRIYDNAHWLLIESWINAMSGPGTVRLDVPFEPADLTDFDTIGSLPVALPSVVRGRTPENRILRASRSLRAAPPPRPPNVIVVVLEAVAARWVSLYPGPYKGTTPRLVAEADHSIVFDNFYAHIGRSSNSLVAMLMSRHPKLAFRDITEEYPDLEGAPLSKLLGERGYRTGFITSSDLSWAGWRSFLEPRGFEDVVDFQQLTCTPPLSSWGVEDRCMVDAAIDWIDRDRAKPFFLFTWTQQTHHPYEPTPDVPMLDFFGPTAPPDDWELGRYLNVLHETDRHLGRLFDAIRERGIENDTMVIITGDHGQAFGEPHNVYGQGIAVYQEDVHVPLMIWSPRRYAKGVRSQTIGSHVDLAPTITDFLDMAPSADWYGRSLFAARRAPRAYFYVAEDEFRLGVRENNWKYILDLRHGVEELYDLDHDPDELSNLASHERARSSRLRQRLSAWAEANRRQYEESSSTK